MTTYGEKLAAAREARPTRDVQCVLDGELSRERDRLMEMLETASDDKRLATKSEKEEIKEALDALTVAASEALVTYRFKRLPGTVWNSITSKHPPRVEVPLDRQSGYNYDAACEEAAAYRDPKTGEPYSWRLDGDELVPLAVEEWVDTLDVLAGSDVSWIRDAVWRLNYYDPRQRLDALVKRSGAASRSGKK